MKKTAAVVLIGLMVPAPCLSYASDWDKAGKALTVIEGLRLVTGGKVDFIGTLAGLNREGETVRRKVEYASYDHHPKYAHHRHYGGRLKKYPAHRRKERVWVPHYVWKREYVPEHKEIRADCGEVIVEAHYIRYKVEEGGHWETKYYWK